MIRRWMTRRRHKREMAEKLESTALKLEADLQETVDKLKESVLEEVDQAKDQQTSSEDEELNKTVTALKVKMQQDKEDCKRLLNMASQVEEKEDESMYKSVFGLIIKDSIDSILKREIVHLTMQMSLFRNNVSRKMLSDDTLTDETPLNIMNVLKGFEEEWKVWKEQDKNDCQEDLSYQALRSLII